MGSKSKIVSIHQPNFIPWLPFFSKIKESDIFIILDTAQYKKNEFMNRNKIKTRDGWMYLTVPLNHKDSYLRRIIDVKLPDNERWRKKHISSIEANYSRAPFFKELRHITDTFYSNSFEDLADMNSYFINEMVKFLGLKKKIIRSSEMSITLNSKNPNSNLIKLIKEVNGQEYISGDYGRNYLEEQLFTDNNIKLTYLDYNFKEYAQLFDEFIPGLSILDLIFNLGPESANFI